MSGSVCIRQYQGHHDDVAIQALIRVCYGDLGVSWGQFRHWHFGLSSALQGMSVAETDGQLVGIQPMEVVAHRLAGRPLKAGVLTGAMVHPDWRRRGIFSRLLAGCEARAWELGAELVWTMPNNVSLLGFLKEGYRNPGERRLLLWSPQPRRLAAGRLPAPLVALVDPAARLFLARRPLTDPRCKVQETGRPGELESEIAVVLSESWPGLLQERSLEWLAWRFGLQTGASYRSFVATDVAGQPAAWAVTTRGRRNGYHAGYLLDVVGVDDAAALAAGRAAVDALADQGVDLVLTVMGGRTLARLCRRLGFVQVPKLLAPKRFFTVFRPRPGESTQLSALDRIDAWYQTLADWDTV
jgi:GNAT superfamily N-acetyltransferase